MRESVSRLQLFGSSKRTGNGGESVERKKRVRLPQLPTPTPPPTTDKTLKLKEKDRRLPQPGGLGVPSSNLGTPTNQLLQVRHQQPPDCSDDFLRFRYARAYEGLRHASIRAFEIGRLGRSRLHSEVCAEAPQ
jgi:hypothetical protein